MTSWLGMNGPVFPVGILMQVDVGGEGRFETLHPQPLKELGNDGGESHRSVVVKGADVALLGHWNDGYCFEAC